MTSILFSLCLDSSSSKIDCTFVQPIHLNLQRYRYFLKLLSVSFSNVFSNITENQEVDGIVFATPGIYDITDLIAAYNQGANAGKLGLNTNTGRLFIENDSGSAITITSSNFLQSDLGGNFVLPVTLAPNQVIYSTSVPIIQTYNYFILTSQSIHNNAYINSKNPNVMSPSNVLYSFSSAMKPFKYKTWVSVEPVEFELKQNILNKIDFELRTGNDTSLDQLAVGDTDFNVHCQIIQIEK